MSDGPDVSVVIASFDRPSLLASCLRGLVRSKLPAHRFEVVISDDGSAVPAHTVADSFRDELDLRVVRSDANTGPAQARNRGVAAARGRYLAFTDDDCVPTPEWLPELLARLEETPRAIVGGRTENGLPHNPFAAASQIVIEAVYDHYNPDPERGRFFATNNMGLATGVFRELRGFDDRFALNACEDRDFCDRCVHAGLRLRSAPDAVVHHHNPLTLRRFFRQHHSYGRGAFHFNRVRRVRGSGRMLDDLGFHRRAGRWLSRPFRESAGPRGLVLLGLLLLSQVAYTTGFVLEAATRRGFRYGLPREA